MVYLHNKNVLFFKAQKIAGTSFEIALSSYADDPHHDIITRISPIDEVLRMKLGYALPRNWSTDKKVEQRYIEAIEKLSRITDDPSQPLNNNQKRLEKECRALFRRSNGKIYSNHMLPAEVARHMDKRQFDRAFKISIVRDPYEMLVSRAFWKLRDAADYSKHFAAMVNQLIAEGETNFDYYVDEDGKDTCDFYIRYENLERDLRKIDDRLGTDLWDLMPNTKHKSRKDRRPARQLLSEDCDDIETPCLASKPS